MPVDPQAQVILDALRAYKGPTLTQLDPKAARAFAARTQPRGPDAEVREHVVTSPAASFGVRSYRPHDAHGALPVLVYFHGGGFVIGSLDGCDALCRRLCVDAGCAVVSVDYRLAPEHKFPAAVDDSLFATRWVAEQADALQIDSARMAVAGESAGGNLAAVVASLCRAQGGPGLKLQALLCPVIDLRTLDTQSYRDNAQGYLLTREMMHWFRGHYLADPAQAEDARCSPLAQRDLSGLPPALIITAEYDPLRDEGQAYGAALANAGVEVESRCYPGAIHTFINLHTHLDAGRAAVDQLATRLRNAFAG